MKIEGERAYSLHRRGVAVDMPVRQSTVHELEILRYEPPELELDLRVSSGTYIRSIADALGGHCVALRRTAVGALRVEDADEETILPPLAAVAHLPQIDLDEEGAQAVASGRPVPAEGDGPVALVSGGKLLAVAFAAGGVARPETVIV